jgi:hypothetical protein
VLFRITGSNQTIKNMSKSAANFLHALVAVLAGNAVYFLVEKYLPAGARHSPFKIDLGMLVDFWFCLVVFGIIKTVAARRRRT